MERPISTLTEAGIVLSDGSIIRDGKIVEIAREAENMYRDKKI